MAQVAKEVWLEHRLYRCPELRLFGRSRKVWGSWQRRGEWALRGEPRPALSPMGATLWPPAPAIHRLLTLARTDLNPGRTKTLQTRPKLAPNSVTG